MSLLTAELLGLQPSRKWRSAWPAKFRAAADRLHAEYGLPRLGNYRDPVREIFFIMLSAKTTDAQYRKTYANLSRRFKTLEEIAAAPAKAIRFCILSGGLAGKLVVARRSFFGVVHVWFTPLTFWAAGFSSTCPCRG